MRKNIILWIGADLGFTLKTAGAYAANRYNSNGLERKNNHLGVLEKSICGKLYQRREKRKLFRLGEGKKEKMMSVKRYIQEKKLCIFHENFLQYRDNFVVEMRRGLVGERSSLKMLPV